MGDHFFTSRWAKYHGKPLLEKQNFLIKYKNGDIRLFFKKCKKWYYVTELKNGKLIYHKGSIGSGYVEISSQLQKEIEEAIIERELLE